MLPSARTNSACILAVLLISAVAGAQTSAPSPATAPSATSAATQPVHKVAKGTIALVFTGVGTFEPIDPLEVRLRPQAYKGELKIIAAAANGVTVKAGDVLLELDPADLTRDLAGAENELVTAKANFEKARADAQLGSQADALALRMQQATLKNAEAAVSWWEQVEGPHMLKKAELAVRLSKASVEDQDDELDQLRKMYKDEELTSATADIVVKRAVRGFDISKQQLEIAQQSAEKTKALDHSLARQKVVDQLDQAKQQLAQLEATQQHAKVTRAAAVKTAELAAAAAEKQAAELKADRAALTTKAPFDGAVVYGSLTDGAWQGTDPRTLRPGEKIAAGAVVMTLAAPGKLRVSVDVPEAKLAWLTPGMKATLMSLAWPEMKLAGVCAAQPPSGKGAGAEQTFKLPIELSTPPDARLSPGMKASVRIDAGKLTDVTVLPVTAVTGGVVRVRGGDGAPQEKEVTLGRSDGTLIEVRDGLKVGDEVITSVQK